MKAKRLKETINNIDGETEIFIRNSINPCGNIQELAQVEMSTFGLFGLSIPCLILNTDSSKILETNVEDDVVDFMGKEKI